MYWRNKHIHEWFVENVQEGVDDCGTYYVTLDKIEELILTVERVLEKKDDEEAKALLPPSEGFFFGSTDKTTTIGMSFEKRDGTPKKTWRLTY